MGKGEGYIYIKYIRHRIRDISLVDNECHLTANIGLGCKKAYIHWERKNEKSNFLRMMIIFDCDVTNIWSTVPFMKLYFMEYTSSVVQFLEWVPKDR